jgi:hypothetical protein
MAAFTLSTCLGIFVSSKDPQYHNLGDLLDVTAPQWSAQHPESHVYAGRPGKVEVTFPVLPDGPPSNTAELLKKIAGKSIDKRFCFINVHSVLKRVHTPSGECTALGYESH